MPADHSTELTIAAANMHVTADKGKNLAKIIRMVGECERLGADLVVFPELALHGYPDLDIPIGSVAAASQHRRYVLEAESIPGPAVEALARRLRNTEMVVQFGLVETGEVRGILYNSIAIVSNDGLIGTYRKIHNALEFPYFGEGRDTPVFPLKGQSVASLICFDLMMPELARVYALKGAEILLVSTAWPEASWPSMTSLSAGYQENTMSLAAEANAVFNQVWVVVSNQCGESSSGVQYAGLSQIIRPSGFRVACAGKDEGFAVTRVNIRDGVLDARVGGFHIMGARRPSCYKSLVAGEGDRGEGE
jgi:predicted amidohydrolase